MFLYLPNNYLIKPMKLPNTCPSCDTGLSVTKMKCPSCETEINGNFELPKILRLSTEEQNQILDFFISSGNIKEMAKEYGVSYPTMRNQMDDLIQKIKNLSK